MSDTKVGALRLRSVRFKNGGYIRKLNGPSRDDDVRFAKKRFGQLLDAYPDPIAGFAVVVWGPDNGSVAILSVNKRSKIPSIMVPDFVRNRLLADQIETWAIQDFQASDE